MDSHSRIQPQQLIDQHKHFTRQAIQNVATNLPNVQKDYFTIGIIGVQNSGKSTLLNNLFGTNFQVLQQIAGTRTTRGILLSLDKTQNFIIMDVQGNDSMDRIEEKDYQKMVATYALVSADVLIINIWSKTLGQYSGSQYQTLNTILDICISQFKQESPKTILFCVRDFNQEEDDQGQIRRKIIKDVNNIWLKAEKPAEYQKYQNNPEKFFNVEVAVLRKYKVQNPKYFLQDVQKLRKRFIDPKDQGYIFAKKKTAFNLPLKDLPQLNENAWQSIKVNKKLNLPNQKQQLSNFRCSQIIKQLSVKFQEQIKSIHEQHSIEDFGKIQQFYLKQYSKQTYLYGKHIVQQKQLVLRQQIKDTIKISIQQIIQREQKKIKEEFKKQCAQVNIKNSMDLSGRLKQIKLQLVQKFSTIFKTLNYQIQGRKQKIEKLIEYFNNKIVQTLKSIVQTINADFQKESSRIMRLLSSQVLNKYFGSQFWSYVNEKYSDKKGDLIIQLQQNIKWAEDRLLQPAQIDKIDETMSEQLKKSIRQQLQKSLINRVFEVFMNRFTKSKDGAVYNFNIIEQKKIAQIYDQARDQCQSLIQIINSCDVQRSNKSSILMFENEAKDAFFESTWLSNALNELDKKMMNQHQTIIRRKKQNQMRKVPWWLFIIILYFVYDDLWFPSDEYPIMNSILTFFLIFVSFFFAIGQQSAFMELWNLLLDLMNNVKGEVQKKMKKE